MNVQRSPRLSMKSVPTTNRGTNGEERVQRLLSKDLVTLFLWPEGLVSFGFGGDTTTTAHGGRQSEGARSCPLPHSPEASRKGFRCEIYPYSPIATSLS